MKEEMNSQIREENSNETEIIRMQSLYQKRWSMVTSTKEMKRLLDICGLKDFKIIMVDPYNKKFTNRWTVQ